VSLLEFAHVNAQKYGSGGDSRRRSFVEANGEPKYKVGEHIIFEVRDEKHTGTVRNIAIDWPLETWVYGIDCDELPTYMCREIPQHVLQPECAVARLARVARKT
jgi:hypothetical protein